MKNNILKNFFSEEYNQNNNYEMIMIHLEKRQLCRKKNENCTLYYFGNCCFKYTFGLCKRNKKNSK